MKRMQRLSVPEHDVVWLPYPRERLVQRRVGFVVIKPLESSVGVPLWCPLCECLMETSDDEDNFCELGCCAHCAMRWAHPRRKAWAEGWRPSLGDVKEVCASRPPSSVSFIVD